MNTEMTGTVVGGVLQLDGRLALPDRSRVRVRIEPIPGDAEPTDDESAFELFKKLTEEHPIDSGGLRYSRDELHERH
jgi:hypothetical protein